MSPPSLFEGIREEALDATAPGAAVLDYGAGAGAMSLRMLARGHRVTAMDVAEDAGRNIAARCSDDMRRRFDFVAVDPHADVLARDPLGTRRYSLVICREVLEHVSNPWKLLAFFNRHLEDGGRALISFPNPAMELWFERRDPAWLRKSAHCRILDPESFRTRAAAGGLAIRAAYGAGAEWSVFWSLLAPLRFPHDMGNPTGPFAPFASGLARLCLLLRRLPRLLHVLNARMPKSLVYELEKVGASPPPAAPRERPTVLLVYDYRDWILHRWTQQIIGAWRHRFDFVSLSLYHAAADRTLKRRLVAAADVVHLLLPHASEVFRDSLDERFIGTVHHWVDFATVAPTVAALGRIVTGADEWREQLEARGVERKRITRVHSGAPAEFFAAGDRAPAGARLRVGFAAKADSNERDRKGTRHFASLVKSCARSDAAARVEFVIAGPGWAPVVAELRAAGAAVAYTPRVGDADMPAWMRSLDIYLMLSDVEGGPATVAEAMAAGCAVLATRIGLARDVLQDGVTGFFVRNTDIEGILALLRNLAGQPGRLRAIGDAAARFADEHLRYTATLAPLGDLYREVADAAAGLRSTTLDQAELARQEAVNHAHAPSAWQAER